MERKHRKSLVKLMPQIIERDGGEWKCHYCGCFLIPYGTPIGTAPYFRESYEYEYGIKIPVWGWNGYYAPQIDHKIPWSQGGSDDLDNLVVSCNVCNNQKGTESYEAFKSRRAS